MVKYAQKWNETVILTENDRYVHISGSNNAI